MAETNETKEPDLAGQRSIDEEKEPDRIKKAVLHGLLRKAVNLSDFELGELLGFKPESIEKERQFVKESKRDPKGDKCYSWDYVLAFDVGTEDIIKPEDEDLELKKDGDEHEEWENGMPQSKQFGQIINTIWKRLEDADLTVDGFRSRQWPDADGGDGGGSDDEKEKSNVDRSGVTFFLAVGITENKLKKWADIRDTDLLINPEGAIEVGRKRGFPLAKRTRLNDDEDPEEYTLPIILWDHLYGEYNQNANPKVYTHYKRLKNNEDSDLMTPFDEKTRLRIIYESIIGDKDGGGAEIKIEDWIHDKKHPLKAVFALHDPVQQEYFSSTWIKNWKIGSLMNAPLKEIRAYFGEPVAFYFGFLTFYLRWLVAPAILGVIFFIWQMAVMASGETVWIPVPGLPIMGLFMIFWCVAFVDFWLRQEARYRQQWGMTKFEEKAVARPQFEGEWVFDSVTGLRIEDYSFVKRSFKKSAVYTVVTLWMTLCVWLVVVVLMQRDQNPTNLELKVALGVANSVMIIVFDILYKFMSQFFNDWENHRTDQDYQDNMIAKSFVFRFVNSFASLFFLAFLRPMTNQTGYYIRYYNTDSGSSICDGEGPEYFSNYLFNVFNGTAVTTVDNITFYTDESYYEACAYDTSDDAELCYDKDWTDGGFMKLGDLNHQFDIAYQGFDIINMTSDDASAACGSWGVDGLNSDGTWTCNAMCTEAEMLDDRNQIIMVELMIQLVTLFLTAIVIQNTMEVGIPFLKEYIASRKQDDEERSEAEIQMEKDRYANTIDDMSEMVVQFGYVTLFVMAFPLMPLLAIINNIFELKVDAINLVMSSQRPDPNGSDGLGTWNSVLGLFSIMSVATNALLITSRTTLLSQLIEDSDENVKLWFFCVFSLFLAIIVAIEKWVIPDVPDAVVKAQERQRLVEDVLINQIMIDDDDDNVDDDDDEEKTTLDLDPVRFNPHPHDLEILEQTQKVPLSLTTADPPQETGLDQKKE